MITSIFDLYCWLIFAYALLSWFPQFHRHRPWYLKLGKICDFIVKPIRKLLPRDLPVDIAPIVAILGLQLAKGIIGLFLKALVAVY